MNDVGYMKRELRRYENRLTVIGTGIMALDIWSLIKEVMTVINDKNYFHALIDDPDMSPLLYDIIVFLLIVFFALFLLLHLYIGLAARSEGFGKQKGWFYLILTVGFMLLYIDNIFICIYDFENYFSSGSDGVISLLIDITTVVTMAEVLYASVRVKTLRQKLSKEAV